MDKSAPTYQIDERWRIAGVNAAFCREFKCTESGLIGRDIGDLMRADWRPDFRAHVSRALGGVGEQTITVPMIAPCGEQSWYTHQLEAIMDKGLLTGYRATIAPHAIESGGPRRWFKWRPAAPRTVWNFETDQLSKTG